MDKWQPWTTEQRVLLWVHWIYYYGFIKRRVKCATNSALEIILNKVQYVPTFLQALVLHDISNYIAHLSKKRDFTHKPLNHRYNEYQTTTKNPVGEIITSGLSVYAWICYKEFLSVTAESEDSRFGRVLHQNNNRLLQIYVTIYIVFALEICHN